MLGTKGLEKKLVEKYPYHDIWANFFFINDSDF